MWYLLFIFVALFFSFALHSVATQGGNSSVLELFSSYVYKIVVIIFKLQFLLSGEIVQKRARSGAKGGERKSIIVSVCTNGLGHAAQCIRVLEVLKKEAIVVEAIVIAKRSKLPEYMNDYFSSYGAEVLDLDIEVDYDSGITINNVKVMVNFVTTLLFHGVSGNRKMCKTINTFQPHVLLNFWEPFAATFINANNECNTKIITLASQGTLFLNKRKSAPSMFFLYVLHHGTVGGKGRMIPFSQFPNSNTIPQIVHLPDERAPLYRLDGDKPYVVAYSCMPKCLVPSIMAIDHLRVVLFAKDVCYWEDFYATKRNVTIVPRSEQFVVALRGSTGLLATPSRGVITQAIALAKPIYLVSCRGHLEQEFNLHQYLSAYKGISTEQFQSARDWASNIVDYKVDLKPQSEKLQLWLQKTDEKILEKLLPHLSSS
jgi:uncharacterized protein (TIGR00661 family)